MQATIFVTFALIAIASAAVPQYAQHGGEIPILRQVSDVHPDGSYSYEYETGNGISASENGLGGVNAQGQAQWTDPEGTVVQLSYVADENGYHPTGSHIPTPPPVPEQIVRALEYIRTHPPKEEVYVKPGHRSSH